MIDVWTVTRTDDHGNTFAVETHATKEMADYRRWELEQRGHKQLYEVKFSRKLVPVDER